MPDKSPRIPSIFRDGAHVSPAARGSGEGNCLVTRVDHPASDRAKLSSSRRKLRAITSNSFPRSRPPARPIAHPISSHNCTPYPRPTLPAFPRPKPYFSPLVSSAHAAPFECLLACSSSVSITRRVRQTNRSLLTQFACTGLLDGARYDASRHSTLRHARASRRVGWTDVFLVGVAKIANPARTREDRVGWCAVAARVAACTRETFESSESNCNRNLDDMQHVCT